LGVAFGFGAVSLIGAGCTTPGAGTPGFDATGLKLSSSGMPSAQADASPSDSSRPIHVVAAARLRNVIPVLRSSICGLVRDELNPGSHAITYSISEAMSWVRSKV
jgi:hypothetical protein